MWRSPPPMAAAICGALDDWYAPLLSRWLGQGAAVCLSGPDRRLRRVAPLAARRGEGGGA